MKTIRLGTPKQTATPKQLKIDIPPSAGLGGFDIIAFASGLQLLIVDMQLKQPTFFQGFVESSPLVSAFVLTENFIIGPPALISRLRLIRETAVFFIFPIMLKRLKKQRINED